MTSSEIPFSVLARSLDALKQSVNQSCHDTTWHGSKQLLFSVSARCWDALTLQQQADLTCCNTLPHCQCSFCIPWVCVKRALMVSVVHNFAIASYLWKKHVFFHIFFAAVLIFATMLQVNGKFWFGDYGYIQLQALSNTIHESHICNWESDEDEMIEENLDFHRVNLPQGQVTRTFAIFSYAKETTWTHLYHNKSAYDCT
jgi:hypothetical protein